MQIRPFTDQDRPALAALQLASWRKAYAPFVPAEALGPKLAEKIEARWHDIALTAQEFVLVAEGAEGLDGFVTVLAQDMPFIDNFHVRPGLYRSGIGRALMLETARALRLQRQNTVALTVLAANERARAFYAALGGETVKVFRHEFLGLEQQVHRIEWRDLSALSPE